MRDRTLVCVVEDSRDVIALENTGQYKGLYHVLGGVISPMQGLGPEELNIKSLMDRVEAGSIKEIILALSPTMEGDTTSFYLYKKLKDKPLKISSLARGVPIGGELEYADEVTLGRSIVTRTSVQFD
jgi:recombination protein RecR